MSIGVKTIQNIAAIEEADIVFTEMLKSFVDSLVLRYSKTSLLENVSPNQDSGPYNRATVYPL